MVLRLPFCSMFFLGPKFGYMNTFNQFGLG
jgi:hypothetical protein